jgi:hypothetical protein
MLFTRPKMVRELHVEACRHPRSVRPRLKECGWPGASDCLIISVEGFSNVANLTGLNEVLAWRLSFDSQPRDAAPHLDCVIGRLLAGPRALVLIP